MVADDLFGASEDFVEGEGGGIEEDGVGGRAKGGFGSVAVAGIAVAEFLEDVLLGERLGGIGWESVVERWCGGGPVLVETTAAANFGGGVEEDFDFGVGEDGGTDVAAFHDDAAGLTEGALLGDHPDAEWNCRWRRLGGRACESFCLRSEDFTRSTIRLGARLRRA
jgi:hypothetical protein